MDLAELLVVADPTTDEQPAVERAAWLAGHAGAELELFVCDFDQTLAGNRFFAPAPLEELRDVFVEHRRGQLEARARALRGRGLTVVTDVLWDAPLHEGIVRKVVRAQPDVVLKDTHHHSALRRTVLSNTDWQLIRTCPAPLWLVKPQTAEIGRILAAVDPSHVGDDAAALDHRILESAVIVADAVGAELHVLHVYEPLSPAVPIVAAAAVPLAAGASGEDYRQSLARLHREQVDALVAERDIPSERVHVEEGNVIDVLPRRAADLGAGLVVMGAVSRSRLYDVFIGGTAENVLEHLPCDALIVKPRGFQTPVGGRGRGQ